MNILNNSATRRDATKQSAAGNGPAEHTATSAVTVLNLGKEYGGRAVVDGLSFEVTAGEIFALLGPNGAGKTTTIEILEGYRSADRGTVRVLGLDPQARPLAPHAAGGVDAPAGRSLPKHSRL